MASRDDLLVEYNSDPRVVEIAEPSAEIIMQDLVDTLRDAEYSFQGMTFKKLINASGKEDLGGGVRVGITVAMQNLLLAFAGRTTPAETGTVTSNPGSPIAGRDTFVDTAADFVAANVQRGSLVINFTDQSIADVVSVDGTDTLTTKTLVNGIGNTYDTNDVYHVFNIVQVSATGGNLTAVDALQATIAAILPTAFTQVVLTSSASATLQEQIDIQYASFGGEVRVDLLSTHTGTAYPNGTPRQPVNNFTDALAIAQERGFDVIQVIGDATIDSGLDFTDMEFHGQGQNLTLFTLDPAAILINTTFRYAAITGTLDGDSRLIDCNISTLNFVNGLVQDCGLAAGTITLAGAEPAMFVNCFSLVPGGTGSTIDMGGSGQALSMNGFDGVITVINKTGADEASVHLRAGKVILDSTVTNGSLHVRGVGELTDNTTGTAVVDNDLVDGGDLRDSHGQVERSVYLDTEAVENGNGYQQSPFNNWTDAVDNAEAQGLKNLVVLADATVDRLIKNFVVTGVGNPVIDFNGQNVDKSEFHSCSLTGAMAGSVIARTCVLNSVTNMDGHFSNCNLLGVLELAIAASVSLDVCHSGMAGLSRPTVSMNLASTGAKLGVRSYSGGLILTNSNHAANEVSLEVAQGRLKLEASCTAGVISARGVAFFEDESVGATIDTSALLDTEAVQIMTKIMRNRMETNPTTGVMTVYDDDNTTVLLTGNIYEDVLMAQLYRGQGMERRNRLT